MSDAPPLRSAILDEIAELLALALRYVSGKYVHQADDIMARIAAERLIRHPEWSGFVVMKRPPAPSPKPPYPQHERNAGIRTPPVTRGGNTC